jgi:hypothetical protein
MDQVVGEFSSKCEAFNSSATKKMKGLIHQEYKLPIKLWINLAKIFYCLTNRRKF